MVGLVLRGDGSGSDREPLDEFDGTEIAHLVAGLGGGVAEAIRTWLLPVPGGPTRQGFSFALTHSRLSPPVQGQLSLRQNRNQVHIVQTKVGLLSLPHAKVPVPLGFSVSPRVPCATAAVP